MKVKVLVKFKDKENGEIRKIGDVFDCTKKRFKDILTVGKFVEEVSEDVEKGNEEANEEVSEDVE